MEFKNIDEFINWLNGRCEDVYSVEDISKDDYSVLKSMNFELVKSQNSTDEHRWYVVDEDIYSISFKGETKYLACYNVGTLKSESMSLDDTSFELKFAEFESYTTIGYRIKK